MIMRSGSTKAQLQIPMSSKIQSVRLFLRTQSQESAQVMHIKLKYAEETELVTVLSLLRLQSTQQQCQMPRINQPECREQTLKRQLIFNGLRMVMEAFQLLITKSGGTLAELDLLQASLLLWVQQLLLTLLQVCLQVNITHLQLKQ